jgi:hypothetical protein
MNLKAHVKRAVTYFKELYKNFLGVPKNNTKSSIMITEFRAKIRSAVLRVRYRAAIHYTVKTS